MNNDKSGNLDRALDEIHDKMLVALDHELTSLAAVDRASARAGMEDRVANASVAALRREDVGLKLVGRTPVRRSVWLTPLKLAAGFALAATVGVTFLAQHRADSTGFPPGNEFAGVEQDVAEWLAISGGATGDLASQLSRLDTDTSNLMEDFSGFAASNDLSGEEGAL